MKIRIFTHLILFIIIICFSTAYVQAASNEIETFIFDFEENGLSGWTIQQNSKGQSIKNLEITTEESYNGNASLVMDVHLDDNVSYLKEGMVNVMLPGNMENKKISIRIKLPPEACGNSSFPNGIQLFAKDYNYGFQASNWKNIGGTYGISTDEWATLTFSPYFSYNNNEISFDPRRVIIVGVKIAAGTNKNPEYNTSIPFQGRVYIDSVQVTRSELSTPKSDHTYDFNHLANETQVNKPFGYGPFFNFDPTWGAYAWQESDISVNDQKIHINSNFQKETCQTITTDSGVLTQCDGKNKGYIGIELKPTIDISNKDNRIVRAELQFDPPVLPENMTANIFVFDNKDAGACMTDDNCYWYRSKNIPVGGQVVNEIIFDLNDPDSFYQQKPDRKPEPCLDFNDIQSNSLKNILKVGIKLHANTPYTGKVYIDNVTIGGSEKKHLFNNLNKGFVTRKNSDFELQGNRFRFAGANNYYLFYKSHYMIDDVLKTMKENNLTVLRTWGFSDGKAKYSDDNDGFIPNGNEGGSFQPEAGLYYEPTFFNFDYVIKSAGEHGIRLIIPLVNYWSDIDSPSGQNQYGGMAKYLEWCGITPEYENNEIINKDLFYSNECAKNYYKLYIQYMLNRVNTLTGIAYKDDPTILAWELANEPRCHYTHKEYCSQNEVYQWVTEISAFIKQNDPNHLVAVGDEGLLNQGASPDDYYNGHFGIDWEKNLSVETIDFGTVHLYPDHWDRDIEWSQKWITDHVDIAEKLGKPIVFEEFGIKVNSPFDRIETYKRWLYLFEQTKQQAVDGDLFWMLAGKVNSKKEENYENNGNYYYYDYDHFTLWEMSDSLKVISNHESCMKENLNCLSAPETQHQEQVETPLTHMNGMSLTAWNKTDYFIADRALDQLIYDNVNWVAINAWFYQDTIHSYVIYKDEIKTPEDDSLIDVITDAHNRGIKVFLKVNLDPHDGKFRGLIDPDNVEQWFTNYTEMMSGYAQIAQDTHVELFSVGCEFKNLSGHDYRENWVSVIEGIKSKYTGKLVYSANWDEFKNVCFWDLMDFIGIDAYFPLDNSNDVSRQDIFNRWTDSDANYHKGENWFEKINETRLEHDKKIIFTEIGYPSANGAADTPWLNTLTGHNETIQANCIAGMVDFWSRFDWFQGVFLWEMMADLSDHEHNPGNTHIINEKLAETVIREIFADQDTFNPDDNIPTPFLPNNHIVIPSVKTFSWSYTSMPETNNFKWENGNTMGWYADSSNDKGFQSLDFSNEQAYQEKGSLKCQLYLNENTDIYKNGLMWVDLVDPINLSGKTVSVALWIPQELIDSHHPNGVQLAFKDHQWTYVDTKWQNITKGNQWKVYQANLPSDVNYSDGADITKIQHLGLKIGSGTGSHVDFKGYIYVDDYIFENESDVTYHLQVSSDPSFSNLLINQSQLSEIFYKTDKNFEQGNTYFWRVRSQVENNWNTWSKVADFTIQITEPQDQCKPPASGDWIITQSCTMKSSATAPANVKVQSISVLTLPDGVTLDIDLKNYNLTVEKGSGVLIKHGATIK
ncbi:endo-1,4-beta-mannosidase [Candidatus Magnetomorum sp. HK-1]|nr:endo-1,4-beta-mannosidase [Candidatus Magnetomorum sp. HK-1]